MKEFLIKTDLSLKVWVIGVETSEGILFNGLE